MGKTHLLHATGNDLLEKNPTMKVVCASSEKFTLDFISSIQKNKTVEFSKFLMSKGIFAQAIRYPTVKKNQARIRISISDWLSKKDIDVSIDILEKAKRKFNLK